MDSEKDAKINVKILFFAKSRELVGKNADVVYLTKNTSFFQIVEEISCIYPQLTSLKNSFILSVNQEYITADEKCLYLLEDDEIAIIPPISGG